MQALLVPVRSDWYALELAWVREVVIDPAPAPLPTTPATVIGLFNLRGQVLPVLDTAALLGLLPLGDAPAGVVVDTPQGPVCLAISGPGETVSLPVAAGQSQLQAAVSWHEVGDRVATLVSRERLLEGIAG